ncbi:MAG TPA: hydantoinase/oxoprolinase family protein [Solirubrobacteraceae bacterium]|nr:hydantoinase/oxoprolinase family protein [Solirubrobacteraceae bacterium]
MIGLDVGGANTKGATVDAGGRVKTASEPLELWREPDGLEHAVMSVVDRLGADGAPVAIATTAELVDVFDSKRAGVLHVLGACRRALPGRSLRVMTTGGELVDLTAADRDPLSCAAANWLATALLVARSVPDAILVDCGGTTTDVIPIAGGEVVARGRTDLERLLHAELVYTGALRTNVAALVSEVVLGAGRCPVSSELFALAADAHLLNERLAPERCTCTFPDGRGPELEHVRARLARVVCADPEQLAEGDLEAIAAAVHDTQIDSIASALRRVAALSAAGAPVIAVGVGAFLARDAARLAGLPLAEPDGLPFADDGGVVAASVALSVLGRE